jgi:hypothetical protein
MTEGSVAGVLDAAVLLALRYGAAAVALVGSHARGEATSGSDVDLVVLLDEPGPLLASDDWVGLFGEGAVLVRSESFGVVEERRLRRPDGLVVEVCVGVPAWAAVDPVDPGTASVAAAGLRVLWDPHGLLHRLLDVVQRR